MASDNKKKEQKKKKADIHMSEFADANSNKGKEKENIHAPVVPVNAEPQRRTTKAERRAAAKQQRAEKRLKQKVMQKSHLGLAPVRFSYSWLLAGR